MTLSARALDYAALDETELVRRARRHDADAFRAIMQRCNQRLFRIARAVLQNEDEAEDALQETYLRAFQKLDDFRGEAGILTWLTRIVLNEARGRLRRRRPTVGLEAVDARQESGRILMFPSAAGIADPERDASRSETRRLLEHAIDDLPDGFRLVFIMREVDGHSVEETAHALGIREETVKTRLHRARRLLKKALEEKLASAVTGTFPFLGKRCERLTERVLARLGVG